MSSTTTKKVPKAALKLGMEPLKFEAGEDLGKGRKKIPLKMRARGGQPINHWFWGRVVHDMSGFEPDRDVIPVDWCHTSEVIGALNKFSPSNEGLDVEGHLAQLREGDFVSDLCGKADLDCPFQASINFYPKSIEEVPLGAAAKVNGYELAGPACIIRQWSCRGVAVCPYGYDNQTDSKFAEGDDGEIDVPLTITTMSQTTTPPAAGVTTPAPTTLAAGTGTTQTPAAAVIPPATTELKDPAKQAQEKLKKYVAMFGADNGVKYFTEGKSNREALELHNADLQTKLTAKDAEIADLKTRLAQAKPGELTAVTSTDTEAAKPGSGSGASASKFAHLGEGAAKFASGIKLPGKNS